MALRVTLHGLIEARAKFKRLPVWVQDAITIANETTAQQIVKGAQARVRVKSGLLRKSIAYRVDARTGNAAVGITAGPAFYGHFQEFGTVQEPARPFMRPAVEAEVTPHERRIAAAGRRIEQSADTRFV